MSRWEEGVRVPTDLTLLSARTSLPREPWSRRTLHRAQMEYLLSHIEKLMNHLKHEASSKVKAYSSASKYDAELEALRNRNAILAQRNATRERVISELRVCVRACC